VANHHSLTAVGAAAIAACRFGLRMIFVSVLLVYAPLKGSWDQSRMPGGLFDGYDSVT